MNTIDFTQPGGLPLDQGILDFLQSSILLAQQSSYLGGSLCILSGCEDNGDNISTGYVSINGEILPFDGGAKLANVAIVTEKSSLQYFDGNSKEVKNNRIAKFSSDVVNGSTVFLWSDFKRNIPANGLIARMEALETRAEKLEKVAAPFLLNGVSARGGIVLWNKPANLIPPGWREVSGWQGLFPVGLNIGDTDFNTVGKTGGAKSKTLTISEIPAHSHSVHDSHNYNTPSSVDSTGYEYGARGNTTTTGVTGGGQPFSILNPYRVVMFIEYIG